MQPRQAREVADLGRDRAREGVLFEPKFLEVREVAELGRDRARKGVPFEPIQLPRGS